MVLIAVVVTIAQYAGILPGWLHRLPEAIIPDFAIWLDAFFNFIKGDMEEGRFGLIYITRWFAEGPLEFMLNTTANLLEGKRRWPNLGPIPWTSIAAVAGVIGYALGGWRLSLLAAGTCIWTALVGQWEFAMQTMSVLVVAAPMAFILGISLGIAAWKFSWV
ncbi:MAG: glycine/betaine ABC transporter permease, partial [Pseudomonadota bacterium]